MRRLAIILYDSLAVLSLMFLVGLLAVTLNGGEAISSTASPFLFAALLGVWFLYLALSWRQGSHQTLGMRAWGVTLRSERQQRISWLAAALRWVTGIVGFALGGIGYWWAWLREDRAAWPDLASASRLVRIRA